MKYAKMNSTDALEFTLMFNSMAMAVAVLWLIANYFTRFGGTIRFLLSFATVMIAAGLGPWFYFAEFSNEMALFLTLLAFMALTMLTAITLSRRLCGGKYRPVCFLLWLALWMLLGSLVATFGFLIVASVIFSSRPSFSEATLVFVFSGSIFGLFLYMLNLPFMILGFAHPFFRERFCACMRFEPMPVSPQKAGTSRINGQNSDNEMPEKGDFM